MELITLLAQCQQMLEDLQSVSRSREISIAVTKMEEVIHRIEDRLKRDIDVDLKS